MEFRSREAEKISSYQILRPDWQEAIGHTIDNLKGLAESLPNTSQMKAAKDNLNDTSRSYIHRAVINHVKDLKRALTETYKILEDSETFSAFLESVCKSIVEESQPALEISKNAKTTLISSGFLKEKSDNRNILKLILIDAIVNDLVKSFKGFSTFATLVSESNNLGKTLRMVQDLDGLDANLEDLLKATNSTGSVMHSTVIARAVQLARQGLEVITHAKLFTEGQKEVTPKVFAERLQRLQITRRFSDPVRFEFKAGKYFGEDVIIDCHTSELVDQFIRRNKPGLAGSSEVLGGFRIRFKHDLPLKLKYERKSPINADPQ